MRKLSSYYGPAETEALARALESSILSCLMNASLDPGREDHWRGQADRMEQKFTTDFGRHYSHYIKRDLR